MPDPARAPHIFFQRDVDWKNKHLNLEVTVERLYDAWNRWLGDDAPPATRRWEPGLETLRAIVREAETNHKRVRALGGAWSLSDAAVCQDYLVNTKPLNHCQVGISKELCAAACPVPSEHLVFAQCGVSVIELNQVLEANNLSLRTSGASNGQTLCGAVATGTHGSANQIGSIADGVHGLHIVAEHGDHYWVQRSSRPAASAKFAQILGATMVEDDDLFNAAVVSFGSFGLVHALLLEVEPIYLLETHANWYDYSEVREAIGTLDVSGLHLPDGDALPFHFEVVVNPYATDAGARGAYVRFMYKRPYALQPPAVPPAMKAGPSEDLITLLGEITDKLPDAVDALATRLLVNNLIAGQLPVVAKSIGTHGQTFGGTDLRGKVLSCELGVPLDRTPQAVEIIVDLAKSHSFAGVIALRFVKPSEATLAFTRHAPYTCTIELPGAYAHRTKEFFAAVWEALRAAGIPQTFHWGQLLPYDEAQLGQAYGTAIDAWLAERRRFLSPPARQTFANDMLVQCGLAT